MRGANLSNHVIFVVTICLLISSMLSIGYVSALKKNDFASFSQVDEWTMFRHDIAHTGFTLSDAPETNEIKWQRIIGKTESSPAGKDGMIFISSQVDSFISRLYCFDIYEGNQCWNSSISGEVICSPAIAYGNVYIGSNNNNLYCFDAETGVEKWHFSSLGDIRSSPVIDDQRVFFGSNDGNLYCIDANSGNLIWNKRTEGMIKSSPAIMDNNIYVVSSDGFLYSFDVRSGDLIWKSRIHEENHFGAIISSPMLHNGKLYIGSLNNKLYCIDASSGIKIWSYTTGNRIFSSAAYYNDKVFFTSNDENIYCLNASDGKKIWSFDMDVGNAYSSPAIADEKLFIGSWDGIIYCLNIFNGSVIWEYDTKQNCMGSPLIFNGKMYIGCFQNTGFEGSFYCIGETNKIPNVSFTVSKDKVQTYETIFFNDTSVDADGYITNVMWNFGDDSNSTLKNVTHQYTDNGVYQVVLNVSDNEGSTNKTSKMIKVLNRPPVAINDTVETSMNSSIQIDVLNNDFDVDGSINMTSLTIQNYPSSGIAELDVENHSFWYTPNQGFVGNDSFSYYVIDDDNNRSNNATVMINVIYETYPIANDDSFQLDEDTVLTVPKPGVLGNDNDPDESPQNLTSVLVDDVDHGKLILYDNGSFGYRPDSDFNGLDSFSYVAFDGLYSSGQATVFLTVIPLNDAPVAQDDSVETERNEAVDIDILSNDMDGDGTLDFSTVSIGSNVSHGSLSFLYEDELLRYIPDTDFIGVDHFNYTIQDDDGAVSNEAKVTITVTGLIPPTASFRFSPRNPTTDDTIVFDDNSEDRDGIIVNWTWEMGDGIKRYEQHPEHIYAQSGTYNVNLTVTDNDGLQDQLQKSLTVVDKNDIPRARFLIDPNPAIVNNTVSFTDESTDSDGAIVSWNWFFGDGHMSTQQHPQHIYAQVGTYRVQLTVKDNDGNSNSTQQIIQIINQSNKPTISIVFPADNEELQGIVEIYGTAYSETKVIGRVDVMIDENGWVAAKGTNSWSFSWNTTTVDNGEHTIKARSFDGSHYSNISSVQITVNNPEDGGTDDDNQNNNDDAVDKADQDDSSSSMFFFIAILLTVFLIGFISIIFVIKL